MATAVDRLQQAAEPGAEEPTWTYGTDHILLPASLLVLQRVPSSPWAVLPARGCSCFCLLLTCTVR
ncbi:hypothetical protein N1851_026565 [Merluccius polli]|uniref:Uncharacterized protein n=1 Tax=Merluccius polli TaxID=89951 RepID=A0AA47NV26_MERPO|nr:hypothetical protein N1851_026565 [Merluccius polli]